MAKLSEGPPAAAVVILVTPIETVLHDAAPTGPLHTPGSQYAPAAVRQMVALAGAGAAKPVACKIQLHPAVLCGVQARPVAIRVHWVDMTFVGTT